MVGLGKKKPVSGRRGRKNIYPEREVGGGKEESSSDVESESGRSSEISSIDSSVTAYKERKGYEAIQALISAALKDKESVHLNVDGRGSLTDVICVTKKEIMKIDEALETVETQAPSAGELPSSSSGVNHAVVSEDTRNGKAGDKKQTDSIPENGSETQNTVVPTVLNWPTDNEVNMEVVSDAQNVISQNIDNMCDDTDGKQVVERLMVALESRSPADGIAKELVNVEGYTNDLWGSAVEVGNVNFYPNASTRPLKDDEYREFLASEESGSESQEHRTCVESTSGNTTLASQVDELQHDEDVLKLIRAPESKYNGLEIVEHEENPPESEPTELAIVIPEENPPASKPHELPFIEDPKENPPEGEPYELVIAEPEEILRESENKKLIIVDPEESPPENICTKLGIIDADLKESPPAEDGCHPTDSVLPEASSDAFSNADFDKLEISDDFMLEVFIKDVEEGPLIDNDLNIEFGNEMESASATTAPPANEGLDETDDSKLHGVEPITEDSRCLNFDTKIDIVQGHEAGSTSCIATTNDEQSEHASIQDEQVMDTEEDETPAEKCLHNVGSSKESPRSSVGSNGGSVRDPRLHRRNQSVEDSASQVSVASTSSSHSSVRPCSVILTRMDASPSASPVRSKTKTKPVNGASPSGKSNHSINTEESMEHDQSKGEPELDGCDDKKKKKPLARNSNEEAAKLTLRSGSCTNDATSSVEEDVVNIEDEPIRLYEPINLDDPIEAEAVSNKTEVIKEAAPDVSSEPVRTTRKRKSSTKSAETDVKKVRPSSMKRESTENPGKLLSSMSKREITAYIKKESKKTQPDFIKLSEAMNITYDPTRKVMYDNGQVDVEIIKKKHPELLYYQMVKDELGRILKDPTKMTRLERELSEEVLSSALEGKKKTSFPSKKRHPLWQKTIKLWGENKGSENSAQYQRVLGMLAVCFEFSENAVVNKLCKILKQNGTLSESDTDKMDTPTIVVKESEIFSVVEEADIWIYVDGEKYIKVPNMYEAVLSVFAAYYIFNITYDKSLKSLFEFFDYLCDNRQSTYKNATNKWPPELRIGVKEFPVLTP